MDCSRVRVRMIQKGRAWPFKKKDRSNKSTRGEAEQRKAVLEAPIVDVDSDWWQAQGFPIHPNFLLPPLSLIFLAGQAVTSPFPVRRWAAGGGCSTGTALRYTAPEQPRQNQIIIRRIIMLNVKRSPSARSLWTVITRGTYVFHVCSSHSAKHLILMTRFNSISRPETSRGRSDQMITAPLAYTANS